MVRQPGRPRRRISLGIQDRIVFWLLVLGIVPVVLTSVLGHLAMTRTAVDTAGERLLRASTETASDIDSRIHDLVRGAGRLCTHSPVFQDEVAKAAAGLNQPAAELVRPWPADSARLTEALLAGAVSRELARFQHENPRLFERIVVTDPAGAVLGATGPFASPLIPPDSRAASSSRLNYLEDEELLEVVALVIDPAGSREIGFVRTYAGMTDLAEQVENTRIGQTGFATLLSSASEVIAAPPAVQAGSEGIAPDRIRRLNIEFPVWYQGRGLDGRSAAVIALAPVSATAGPGRASLAGATWVVSVEQNKVEVLAAPHQFGRAAVLVVLLTAALVMVVGLYLSERIVQPLRRLRDGARRIGAGQLSLGLELRTGDEIEELATEFTAMAQELAQSYRGLEEKVRLATEELARKNDSLEAILAALGEGLMVLSSGRRILLWNPAAETMTGYRADEVIGQRCADILKPGTETEASICAELCPVQTAIGQGRTGARHELQTCITTRSGSRLPVSVTASPLAGSEGRTEGCVVVLRDMSRERELDRLKSEMVSMVSHELRTPLGPLIGFAELLQDPGLPEEKRNRYLHIIIEQGRRLSGLIDNFLTLSQIEAGKFELNLQDTDLYSIALEVIAVEAGHNPKHNLVNGVPPGFPRVKADPDRIRRVVHNLVSNAVKYSPDGGTITVSARDLGREVEVAVSDQGVGIRREDISRLFHRFARVHRDALPEVGGTGLGLSICKTIIDEHDGTIQVESKPGKGSTFFFRIPKHGPASEACTPRPA